REAEEGQEAHEGGGHGRGAPGGLLGRALARRRGRREAVAIRVTRIAVIGHVEWVLQARSRTPVARGEIVQLYDTFDEPAGGGGVAARALPALGAETRFYTALGNDDAAAASERVLAREGCELRVARRAEPQNRVTTISDPDGERTILVHGPNAHPTL